MRVSHKALVLVLTIFASLALVLGAAGPVRATQNSPSWATGNQWTYSVSGGTTTIQWVVHESTTVTVNGTAYNAWHLTKATTSTSGGTTVTVTVDNWITISGSGAQSFAEVKQFAVVPFFGNTTTTWSPPEPLLVFPLTPLATWSLGTTENVTTGLGTVILHPTYTGEVLSEAPVTVAAGTFTAAAVRVPASGNPYTVYYYSDAVGFYVQVQHYNGAGTLTSTESLASYSYTGNLLLWILVGIGLLAAVAIAGLLFLRRRRGPRGPRAPSEYPPQQPPPPGEP